MKVHFLNVSVVHSSNYLTLANLTVANVTEAPAEITAAGATLAFKMHRLCVNELLVIFISY